MTRITGTHLMAAPCCGKHYSVPRYASMNFSAFEYWTDGWRYGSLMPNDEGLRRCECGKFVLMSDLIEVESVESTDLVRIASVPSELLPECIAMADREEVEVAARLGHWHSLNHNYREKYRKHREVELAAATRRWESAKAIWQAANPDRRTWWDKLRGRKPPSYSREPEPFNCPTFEPSAEQLQNMQRLSELLLAHNVAYPRKYSALTLAELFREQGRFAEAEESILAIAEHEKGVASKLICDLVSKRQTAPIRYMV